MNINDNVFTEDVSLSNIPSSKDKARAKLVTDSVDVVNSLVYPKGNITRSLSVPETSLNQDEISESFIYNYFMNISDAVDANVQILAENNVDDDDDKSPGPSSTPIAIMSVTKDAECYNMNHKNRGKCVIFNHEIFDVGFEKRKGSATDAERLQRSFSTLDFDVEVHNDLSHVEVMNEIEKLSQLDHTDNDCLCVFVLTHGLQNDLIFAKDAAYRSDKIWKPFTADKCLTLAGKPKIFFFQACRGNDLDDGVILSPRGIRESETDSISSYKIPTHADFLIAHSSVQGFYTWRNPIQGTWYIQCLCDVLNEYGTKLDLITMLTKTARRVATDYTSNNTVDVTKHNKKQVPSVTTMLLRYVYFLPKSKVRILA